MAINIRCQKCSSDMNLTAKKCSKCGAPIPKNKKYRVIVRVNGKRVTKTTTNLELARDIESKLNVDITRGEYDIQKKKPAITLNKLWKKYLPSAKVNKKTWKNDENYYNKHLEPVFGGKRLDAISQFDIEKFIVKMKKSKSKRGTPYALATIKHQLVILTRLYSVAEKWGLYSGDNPCRKVVKPKLNNQVTEFLTDEELTRLLEVLDGWDNEMSVSLVFFCLYTGLRRGEIFKLTWNDIDTDRKKLILRDPKGILDQVLPLSDKAIILLKNLPKEYDTKWIFYGRAGRQRTTFQTEWAAIKKAASLPKAFRFHGLRHHFASSLVSAGTNLYTVQKLLCHKDAAMTQRYAHLADKTLRDAVNLSDDLLEPKVKSEVVNLGDHKNGN